MRHDRFFVQAHVHSLLAKCNSVDPPNLIEIAGHQRIRSIICCELPAEGMIEPVPGGFQVYLRSPKYLEIDMQGLEPPLSRRTRFTLAHEIVHTFFYSPDPSKPQELDTSVPQRVTGLRNSEIEALCQFGAGWLSVPPQVLDKRFPAGNRSISPEQIEAFAEDLRVSVEVAVRRLKTHTTLTAGRSVICLETRGPFEDWRMRIVWCGDRDLDRYLRVARYGERLNKWFSGLSLTRLLSDAGQEVPFGAHRFRFQILERAQQQSAALLTIQRLG